MLTTFSNLESTLNFFFYLELKHSTVASIITCERTLDIFKYMIVLQRTFKMIKKYLKFKMILRIFKCYKNKTKCKNYLKINISLIFMKNIF